MDFNKELKDKFILELSYEDLIRLESIIDMYNFREFRELNDETIPTIALKKEIYLQFLSQYKERVKK